MAPTGPAPGPSRHDRRSASRAARGAIRTEPTAPAAPPSTGLQNATVRRLAVPDLTSTVLTQTLTGLASESLAAGSHPRQGRRIAAVVAMVTGAPAGGVPTLQAGLPTALAVTAVVFALVTVGFAVVLRDTDHQASRPPPRVVQPGVPRGGACLLPRPRDGGSPRWPDSAPRQS